MLNMKKILVLLLLTTLFSGCAMLPEEIDETKDWPPSRLYSEGKAAMEEEDYELALALFGAIESRYPYGRYAQQAQMETAYTYFKYEEPEAAVAACDRFIRLHPRHPNVDYMYYLKGLVNFERDRGFLDRYLPQDPTHRDPGSARQSFYDFAELVRKLPKSKYTKDAIARMRYLRNNLAQYEVNVSDYYMRRGAYIAAVNRAKYVVENFPNTPARDNALGVMALGYKVLKMDDLSSDALRVLMANNPDHPAITEVTNFKFE